MRHLSVSVLVFTVLNTVALCQSNILFEEHFDTDGDGVRYTLEGRGIANTTPIRGFDHSFLMPTVEPGGTYTFPAPRVALPWSSTGTNSVNAGEFAVSAVDWATDGTGTEVALMAGGALGAGEQALRDTLTTAGFNVNVVSPTTFAPADPSDLLFISESVSFQDVRSNVDIRAYDRPIVTASADVASGLLITNGIVAGAPDRRSMTITNEHPLRPEGGFVVEQTVDLVTEAQPLAAFGTARTGVTTVANYRGPLATQVNSLNVLDAMVDGTAGSVMNTATFSEADFYDNGPAGVFEFNNELPGGGGDDYGFVANGTITIAQNGTYGFGIGSDDGGRLRINGQDLIVNDELGGFGYQTGTLQLPAGDHTFEWSGFERGGSSGFELAVTPNEEAFGTVDAFEWDALSTDPFFGEIRLKEPMQVTRYQLDVANSPEVDTPFPAILAVEAGLRLTSRGHRFEPGTATLSWPAALLAAGFQIPTRLA